MRVWRALARRADVLLLAALAYVPALTAAPGRMPADSKLFLYLDPGRLISDARWSWDERQFGGWVPHQLVAYLWPSGPWFWTCERLGLPDWIAHRLWIGSLLLAAGLGARWAARRLGLPAVAALVAALVYQLTPYIVPYVSRTSVMLLPWAGLGWLIGLTVRAATGAPWRHAAMFALVVATVGGVNATATAMIAPAPALWLAHAAAGGTITWRRAASTAARLGALSLAVSLWWIAMLAVQGRYGADVLAFSETLRDVSFTSNAVETARGFGYWLFYVRDPVAAATSAAEHYMRSPAAVAISFALLLAGLAGLTATRWRDRRFAALLVGVGIVLAVGVHPIDDPSPLMSAAAGAERSTPALALRSSTRSLPLAVMGLALATGALACATARRLQGRRRSIPSLAAGALAIANLPLLWTGGLVDPALERAADPPQAWRDAAAALGAGSRQHRVMQLPGAEFAAYRWGFTVDPALPGLTTKPLIARDLLPLGSPAVMDLMFALDDRFQDGIAEPDAIAAVARLLGVDTIWVPGDLAFERFGLPRPEQTAALFTTPPAGLGVPVDYGEPEANLPAPGFVDEARLADPAIGSPLAPVTLVPVTDPVPVVRAKANTVVVAGSGDGIVDAAAAGVIDGSDAVVYAGTLSPSELATHVDRAALVVVTDSNRDRAHHWRSSQDVTGFTEPGGEASGVLAPADGDERLRVVPGQSAATQTIAEQRGPVTAAASAYGAPYAYRPENRAAMALDGDPGTAWTVADRADPTGQYIEITAHRPARSLTLLQPTDPRTNRWLTRLALTVDGAAVGEIALDESSRSLPGQVIALPTAGSVVRLTITGVGEAPRPSEPGLDGVGFAEIVVDGAAPTHEVTRVPVDALGAIDADDPLAIVLTRLRVDAADRWRADPEKAMTRAFILPEERTFDVTVEARLSRRASDATIAQLLGIASFADRRLAGALPSGGWSAADRDPSTAWQTPVGEHPTASVTIPLDPSRPLDALTVTQRDDADHSVATQLRVSVGADVRDVVVPRPDADGESVVRFEPLRGDTLRLEIVDAAVRTATDRRTGELVALPVAISEVSAPAIIARPLPATFTTACRDDLLLIDGVPMPARLSGSTADAFAGKPLDARLCDSETRRLGAGEHLVTTAAGADIGLDVDRVVLRSGIERTGAPSPAVSEITRSRTGRTVRVGPCPQGCWLVFGEGFNEGWTASSGGAGLGRQTLVDGGFNGWWLAPSDAERVVTLRWSPQRLVDLGGLLSIAAILACVALTVLPGRRTAAALVPPDPPALQRAAGLVVARRAALRIAAATTVVAALCVSLSWGAAAAALAGLACVWLRRPTLLGWVSIAITSIVAARVLVRLLRYDVPADPRWPQTFEDLHRPMLLAIVLVATAALNDDADPPPDRPADPDRDQ